MTRFDLHKSVHLASTPASVFDALTNPQRITAYFPVDEVKIEPVVGGLFTIHGQTGEDSFTDHGTIESFEPAARFRYRYWSTNHGTERLPENRMVIDYRLTAEGGGTRLDVAHENLLDQARQTTMDAVWDRLLALLKDDVESRPTENTNWAIEFHDSHLAAVIADKTDVLLRFEPAYVHASNGRPGWDPGTGWAQTVQVRVGEAKIPVEMDGLRPATVSDGQLEVDGVRHDGCVPFPLDLRGVAHLRLVLESGQVFDLRGNRIRVGGLGDPVYVEEVP